MQILNRVSKPHYCYLPNRKPGKLDYGTIIECDCGKRYELKECWAGDYWDNV